MVGWLLGLSRRWRAALLAAGYVVPLGTAVALLVTHGLVTLGVALLVVELGVVAGIKLARRPLPAGRPRRAPGEPVLGLPGDRLPGTGGRTAVLLVAGLTAVVLLIGLGVALASA